MDTDENISSPQQAQETLPETSKKPPRQAAPTRAPSASVQGALQQFEQLSSAEEKIRAALEFMRNALSQPGSPRFKDFWDIRGYCLPLFKMSMNQISRSELWAAYIEISTEARRLKEILDEQSAFAVEQIELAIVSAEKDLTEFDTLTEQLPQLSLTMNAETLREKQEAYEGLQRELNLLNALASRVNSLRKEVIKTDMRIKTRTKFFDRLSVLGDKIFPRRKELIKEISEHFVSDVEGFVNAYFEEAGDRRGPPLYVLREEIKSLQGVAKELTLSTHAFNHTRQLLSECWDKLRELDKRRKEEVAQKKEATQGNVQLVREKIAVLAQLLQEEATTIDTAQNESQAIYDFMRTIELSRDDVFGLKEEVRKLLEPLRDRAKAEENERVRANEEQEKLRKEKIQSILDEMQNLETEMETLTVEAALQKKQEIEDAFAKENVGKHERMQFSAIQRKIKDQIVDKKAATLLKLSAGDRQAFLGLKEALQERREMREEIKRNLENYRKSLGSSGFDFEKAMAVREMIDGDKERLAKLNESIKEIEEKIDEFENTH